MITLLLTEPALVLEPRLQLPPDLPDLADLSERLGEAETRLRGYGEPGHIIVIVTWRESKSLRNREWQDTPFSHFSDSPLSHCDVAAPVQMLPGLKPISN